MISFIREQKLILLSLMISFGMIMREIFFQDVSKHFPAEKNIFTQGFIFDGAHPSFGVCVEVW